jgi:hypothetical protein
MRETLVVHNRYAWRSHRTRAALTGRQGLQLLTIEQLAARLAGGFIQPIDPDDFNGAVAAALAVPMGELDAIKVLPGFRRAAASSLAKAWTAGVNLAEESESATDPTAKSRLASFATLEREVLAGVRHKSGVWWVSLFCVIMLSVYRRSERIPECLMLSPL